MTDAKHTNSSRRDFLKSSGQIAAAAAVVGGTSPQLFAGENNTIQIALVGCGGRGTGAAQNALSVQNGPIKLVAMADVFPGRLASSYGNLNGAFKGQKKVEVPEDQKFIGFDGYKKAMDCLKPGDIVILTTPCAFRWVHYKYAIDKRLNVFMEKPLTTDGPTSVRMLELNKQAEKLNLKVGVGLMCRHCKRRQELFDRIQNGELGELNLLRAYRMAGPTGSAETGPQPKDQKSELLYQISRFHAFIWLSGGAVSDFLIHNIDEGCWMKNDWPINAKASGARHYRGSNVDQNFDTYSIEYTFKDGAKLIVNGRTMRGCHGEFATYAHGSKGSAVVSSAGHAPSRARIYSGQNEDKDQLKWSAMQPEPNPYQVEWNDLIQAIRKDETYNEVFRGVMASAVTSMGRVAAHTGQLVTLDQFLGSDHELAPGIDKLTLDSPSPLQANSKGKYPVPLPGLNKEREYA
ncbi:MAG: twin-arginine translocation signal domain-containing protein [Planctomycetota bacterium]|nr:twin-arginine translocation signal domain-containing protein [Planctomycetota bacterium]